MPADPPIPQPVPECAEDLARAAGRLLELADQHRDDPEMAVILELAAAMFCTHVADWEARSGPLAGVAKDKWHAQWKPFADQFADRFPDWSPLRELANGTKHGSLASIGPDGIAVRPPEWEDNDWWAASGRPGLIIGTPPDSTIVSATIRRFAEGYLGIDVADPEP